MGYSGSDLRSWLRCGESRTAAVILLIFSGSNFVLFTLVALPILISEMGNIDIHTVIGTALYCLAAITMYAAAKAVEATFKLHGPFKLDPPKH